MGAIPADAFTYRFGPYTFAAGEAELRLDDAVVPLAPKPAQLLHLLIRNRGRTVTREEILATLWPGIRVSEAAFNSVVRDLRRALHDRGRESKLIATSRGRGLRFVAELAPPAGAMRLLAPPSDPYVGRELFLATLYDAFDAARAGAGRVVLVGGEAGVGKTCTAKQLAIHAHGLGAAVHYGRCWRPGFAPPFRPWVELLESMADEGSAADRAALLGAKLVHLSRLVPSLGAGEALAEPHARFEVFDAVATWIGRASRNAPILLVLDDLEDADDSTLSLLEFVAGQIETARVLLLANCRTPALEPGHPLFATLSRLARLPHFRQVTLTGLDADETRTFVGMLAERGISDDAIDSLRTRTDGNPLLLSLLARSVESGAAASDADRSTPMQVREWIRGQLQTLPHEAVECLRAAATIGRVFDESVIAEMLGRDIDEVVDTLASARRAGLLGSFGVVYSRFAHSLLQEAIYAETPPALRMDLHRRAGEAFQKRQPGDLLAAVARHLCLAVELVGERAVEAAERAADHAEHKLAFEEAIQLLDLALDTLRVTPRADPSWRCELLVRRSRALLAARRVREAWESARETVELAREIGSTKCLAHAALLLADYVLADSDEPAQILEEALRTLDPSERTLRAEVACALSTMLWYRGESERRSKLAREARAAAKAIGGAQLEIHALLAERHALHGPAHLSDRIRLTSEALALADRQGNESLRCLVVSWRAVDLLEGGDLIGAQLDVDAVERLVELERAPRFRAFPERWRALRAILAGRFEDAERHIGEAHLRMRRSGDPNADAYASIQSGLMLLEQGRSADVARMLGSATWLAPYRERVPSMTAALALIDLEAGRVGPARRLLDANRGRHASSWAEDPELLGTASWLAEICARLGDAEVAEPLLDALAPYGDRFCGFYAVASRGSFARYLGLLARTAGRLDDAPRWFETAVEANRAIDAHVYAAWAQWEWAETLALRGVAGDLLRARGIAADAERSARELGIGRLSDAMRRAPLPSTAAPLPRSGAPRSPSL